jgi:DNA-binding GntR family transcriptional regulator
MTTDAAAPPAVAARPLPQQVANVIRDMIIHDQLKPGERIREQHISARLQVSRTPLREALKILAVERLVEILPNRGAVVVNPGVEEIRGMLRVYSTLEALGGELACKHASAGDIAHVEQQYDRLQAAFSARDRLEYFSANQAFHVGIVAGSHNASLIELHGHLNMRLYRVRYLAIMQLPEWTSAVHQHDSIVATLKKRDGRRLARLLDDHLGFARRLADGMETA